MKGDKCSCGRCEVAENRFVGKHLVEEVTHPLTQALGGTAWRAVDRCPDCGETVRDILASLDRPHVTGQKGDEDERCA